MPFLVIFLILSCFSPSTKVNGKDRRRQGGTVKRSISNDYSFQNPGVRFYSATEPNLRQNFSINSCRINNHQGTLSSQILKAACGWDCGSYFWYLHQCLRQCSLLKAQAGTSLTVSPGALGHSPQVTPALVGKAVRIQGCVSSMHIHEINF